MSFSKSSLLGTLALLAVLCLLAVIGLQVAEYLFFRAEPSLWPM